jgi:hypothetical protein
MSEIIGRMFCFRRLTKRTKTLSSCVKRIRGSSKSLTDAYVKHSGALSVVIALFRAHAAEQHAIIASKRYVEAKMVEDEADLIAPKAMTENEVRWPIKSDEKASRRAFFCARLELQS